MTSSHKNTADSSPAGQEQTQQRRAGGRAGRVLRRLLLGLAIAALVLIAATGILLNYLPWIAQSVVLQLAADAGVEDVALTVDEMSLSETVISNVVLGASEHDAPDLEISRIAVTYDIRDLIQGNVQRLAVEGITVRGTLDETGLDLGSLGNLGSGNGSSGSSSPALSLDHLSIERGRFELSTPEGDAIVLMDGTLALTDDLSTSAQVSVLGDIATGGFTLDGSLGEFGLEVGIRDLSFDSAYGALGGRLQIDGAEGFVLVGEAYAMLIELQADIAYAPESGRDLPVSHIAVPLDVHARFEPENGTFAARLNGCLPFDVSVRDAGSFNLEDVRLCPDERHPLAALDMTSNEGVSGRLAGIVEPVVLRVGRVLEGVAPRARAVVDLGAASSGVLAKLDLTGGNLQLPGQQISLSDVNARLTVMPGASGQAGKLDVAAVTLTDTQAALRFVPMVASAELSLDVLGEDGLLGGLIQGPFSVGTPARQQLADGSMRHSLASGGGEASFDSGTIAFSEGGLQPQELAPVLSGVVAAVTGETAIAGRVAWNRAGVVSSPAKITMAGLGLQAAAARFDDVSGTIEFSSLIPVRTKGTQAVSIGVVNAGVPLAGGVALVRVEGGGNVVVENAQWPFAGGQLVLTSSALNTNNAVQRAKLAALKVDIADLLSIIDLEGLTGEGTLGGAVPIEIRDGSVFVTQARLEAEPGGVIRYSSPGTDAAAQTAEGANIAFQALENFHFKVLSAEIDGPVDGDLTLKLVLEGANPDLLEGYPVHLNITTQGAFMELLRRGTVGFRALDIVTGKENPEGLNVERVEPLE